MDAYVYNMTKNFQHEPQQTEMQRIGPDIEQIFQDWESPERAKAAHYHMLAALSMRPMGNYDYAFIQREVLRTFSIGRVEHLFCVLVNGSGCAVQVLKTPCLTPRDMLEVVTDERHDKLWQKRLPNWKRLGVDSKPTPGPLFKVPVRFMDKNIAPDDRRPAWADPDQTPPEFNDLPAMRVGADGLALEEEDEARTDKVMMQKLQLRGCSGGDDSAVYSADLQAAEDETRTVMMFVSQCTAVDAALDLVVSLYDKMVSNYQARGQDPPLRRIFTAQTPNQSRGTSVKDSNYGSFVTDLLSNQAWDTDSKSVLMKGTAVLDEGAQAFGRACELRRTVPAEVLKYQAENGPLHVLRTIHMRDYSDPVWGLYYFCKDNPRFIWTNANKRTLIQKSLNASQELMTGLQTHYALGRSAEEIVSTIIAEAPGGALHTALFTPIAYVKRKKQEEPAPLYMSMGSEKGADENAREAIRLKLDESLPDLPDPPTIDLVTADADAEVRERLDGMLATAVSAPQQVQPGNALVQAFLSPFDTQMQGLAMLRSTADDRAKERKNQQQQLREQLSKKEKEIKSRSAKEHAIVNPSNSSLLAKLVTETFGLGTLEGLISQVKQLAETQQVDQHRIIKGKDFASHCRFAIGSMIQYHEKDPQAGPLATNDLRVLLLDTCTHSNMKVYTKRTNNAKNYLDHVMGSWRAFHGALVRIDQAGNGAGSSNGGASSGIGGLLMPPAPAMPPSGGASSAPHTPPGGALSDAIDLTD